MRADEPSPGPSGVAPLIPPAAIPLAPDALAALAPAIVNAAIAAISDRELPRFSLRSYFRVSPHSISVKLQRLFFPFTSTGWSRPRPESEADAIPRTHPNLPDLYIPIVSAWVFLFLTAVLRAIRGRFRLEQIGVLALKLGTYLGGAAGAAKGLVFVTRMPGEYPILTLLADLGVLPVYLALCQLACQVPRLRMLARWYCVVAAVFWTVRTMKPRSDIQSTHRSYKHEFCILALACVQAAALFFFTD
jgi:hypothetical protein